VLEKGQSGWPISDVGHDRLNEAGLELQPHPPRRLLDGLPQLVGA
jgi:hypothetical protein